MAPADHLPTGLVSAFFEYGTGVWRFAQATRSEALAMHDDFARILVFVHADPHLLKGGEGGKNGGADKDRVLALVRCHRLDLHRRRR